MKKTGMVLRSTLIALLLSLSFAANAQTTDTTFAKEWALIDSLILKQDLTKTALARLDELSAKANKQKLPAQAVKALIYRYTLQDRIITDDRAHAIKSIGAELNKTTDPTQKAVLYSLLASQYAAYYRLHRWELLDRKNTLEYDKKDINTWSAKDFDTAVINNYKRSLKDKRSLQQINISSYDAVIIKGNMRALRPTLFDLLAHTALDEFSSPDDLTAQPAAGNVVNADALLPADVFLSARFSTSDSTDRAWQALALFRDLLRFHYNDADKNALIDADLRRIQWAYEQASFPEKETVYLSTLRKLTEQFPQTAATIGAWQLLAGFEIEKAGRYQAQGDTANRYGFIKAEKILEKALALFPASNPKTIGLQRMLHEMRQKALYTETETVNLPGKPILAIATYRNTDTLFGRIYRIAANRLDDFYAKENELAYWQKIRKLSPVRSFIQPLPATNDHQTHIADFKLDALPAGAYLLVTSSSANFPDTANSPQTSAIQQFHVSRISYIKNENDLFVLDRETGQPMAGVKVALVKSQYNQASQKMRYDTAAMVVTDKNGFARSSITNTGIRYALSTANDTLNIYQQDYTYGNPQEEKTGPDYEKRNSRVFFFTDRSIYRPGQAVYFKGIAITKDAETRLSKLITSKNTDWVYLKDVNGKSVDSIQYALNSFGSFTGSFRLPATGITGSFQIETKSYNRSRVYFSVEEYKRPLFNVVLEKPKNAYRLNDTIIVTGIAKGYAGNTLGNAKVVYNVTRTDYFPIFYTRRQPAAGKDIAHGETYTDKDGRFTIRFKAIPGTITDSSANTFFDFSVTANITDINGETRTANTRIRAGLQSLVLQLPAPSVIEKDSLRSFRVSATNLAGEKQAAKVQVKIQSLVSPARAMRQRLLPRSDQHTMTEPEFHQYFPNDEYRDEANPDNWPVDRTVLEQEIDTKDTSQINIKAGSLPAGYYKIEATTTDGSGKKISASITTLLIDRTRLVAPWYNVVYPIKEKAEPGEEAIFVHGTSAEKIYLISSTIRQNQQTKTYDVSSRNAGVTTLRYTPKETDRGGLIITEAFVYNNRFYTNQYSINVPWSNKALSVNYASYRNKTEPGAKETWTITINGNKADSTAAELLTAMYDASLDQFQPHSWAVPAIWGSNLRYNSRFDGSHDFSIARTIATNGIQGWHIEQPFVQYDRLAMNAQEFWGERYVANDGSLVTLPRGYTKDLQRTFNVGYGDQNKVASQPAMAKPISQELRGAAANKETVVAFDNQIIQEIDMPPVQVRRNLQETAFFFPQLHADSTGKYSFSFTMPESLTQWKWMAFAHTKNLSLGSAQTTIITQKKLMVQPNAPRFLREGDNIEFSAKIVNMTDQEIRGQATLELIDASTNTAVDGWFNNLFPAQYFTAEANQSIAIKFPVQVPFSFNKPLTWRIVAKAGDISDGEENILPVLSNRILVTETLPMFLATDTTQEFRFEKLLNNKSETLTNESLTVEYTSNPAWYAVQALPYLMEYPYECSEQIFNRFYANTLAAYIVNKHPRIKQLFDQWKADSTVLLSNLQKNQELKQLLLQETPWVLQAATEEQQKKNIALLFDLAKLGSQTEQFIVKLEQVQLADGSFSWFKGGYADRYITNYILTGIGKLKRLGALTPDIALRIRNTLIQALRYADRQIVEDYQRLKQSKADLSLQHVSNSQLDYLYMRSFFADIAPLSFEASAYYYGQTKKYWTSLNTYYKAQFGLIAYRNKEERFVNVNIIPALLENTVTDTKLGMYWKNSYTNFWYQAPVEHQSMMIAFFSEVRAGDFTNQLNQMKTWLLLNKQTTNWRTTIATADACYALLLNGSDWLNTDRKVIIRLGNYTAASNLQPAEAGTGYFKKRIDGKLVNEQMGNISVTTSSNDPKNAGPSWGSVYWQYFEEMDKISSASGPLSLTKQLFLERNTDKGKLLELIKDGTELKPGDRIVVRLVLRSDRDMDYLHLKDMRAAAMEPVNVLSGYKWQERLGYYESTKDLATDFFIDHLNKGTYVFEYPLFVTHTGVFSVGIATIQNMYAPEFSSHSEGIKIRVGK
jgi:uncharacterized protein YfaS (alpha-2-macroglobulin family)